MVVVMDIQKLRQEFEKLPDIKGILHGSDFGFNESLNQYYHPDHANHRLSYAFIMGAWMAWITKVQVPDGFILVPREMPKSFDEGLYVYSNNISIVDERSEGFIPMSDINHTEVWKLVIEAQEQSHD